MLFSSWLRKRPVHLRRPTEIGISGFFFNLRPRKQNNRKFSNCLIESLESRCLLTTTAINLSSLGSAGATFLGIDAADQSGSAITGIGDFNGDGYDDFLIGALNGGGVGNNTTTAGESYVIFGRPDWSNVTRSVLDSPFLDGDNGITLYGIDTTDLSGHTVARAGDFNGDGFADLMIGADAADGRGNNTIDAGETYVVFGKAIWRNAPMLNLTQLDGTNGFTLYGVDPGDHSGSAIGSAGDVNGDGFDDLLIGAPLAAASSNSKTNAGETYLVFGRANWSETPSLTLNTGSLDGVTGVTLFGADIDDQSGAAVTGAGDVNGDGFDDLLIGAAKAFGQGNTKAAAGEAYLVFGKADWTASPTLSLIPSNLDGQVGVTLFGVDEGDQAGWSVSRAGDVNGDGFDDVLIGAPMASAAGNLKANAGESYVVFGKANWTNSSRMLLNTSTLNGTAGLTLFGADSLDTSGNSVSSAGDVNGDGFDDILIAASAGDGNGNLRSEAGEGYLIFGKSNWKSTKTVDLSRLNGTNGLSLYGIDVNDGTEDQTVLISGNIRNAGDVNGDGFSDFLLSARFADGLGNVQVNAGETYLVFGTDFNNAVTQTGTPADETLTGTVGVDKLLGGRGNDLLISNGGADVLIGGQGNDTFEISSTAFARIDGGAGSDTLRLIGAGLNLDLKTLPDNRLVNIETLDIRGSGANSLTLTVQELFRLSSGSNPDHSANIIAIRRDEDDTVDIGPGWTKGTDRVIGGVSFEAYTQGAATLLLDKLSQIHPLVSLNVDTNQIIEAGGSAVVTATLSEASDINVVISLTLSGTATFPADFTRDVTEIVIPAGSTTGTVTFTAVQDLRFEPGESFQVEIQAVTGGTANGLQQVTIEIIDDDNAPVFNSSPTVTVPETTTFVQNVSATDADLPAQTVTYSITGGLDQDVFTISSTGVLQFKTAPNFEGPADSNFDNQYQVEVTANDGAGGVTQQTLTVTVSDVDDAGAPELLIGGPEVTWTRGTPAAAVLPQISVSGDQLANGTLKLQVKPAASNRRIIDRFNFAGANTIGTSAEPTFVNGILTVQIQLNSTVTAAEIQSFLRGISFSTRGTGLSIPTRSLKVTLTDSNQFSSTVTQTIRVRRRP